jgi:hypothetical protein
MRDGPQGRADRQEREDRGPDGFLPRRRHRRRDQRHEEHKAEHREGRVSRCGGQLSRSRSESHYEPWAADASNAGRRGYEADDKCAWHNLYPMTNGGFWVQPEYSNGGTTVNSGFEATYPGPGCVVPNVTSGGGGGGGGGNGGGHGHHVGRP